MKYAALVQEFLNEDTVTNRVFQFDNERDMRNCYHALWKRHLNLYLFCNVQDYSVIISKEPLKVTMEYKDNVDPTPYEEHKRHYGSKYTTMLEDFLTSDARNREIVCSTPTQTRSCRDSMVRLLRRKNLEQQIKVTYNLRTKTVLLTRRGDG